MIPQGRKGLVVVVCVAVKVAIALSVTSGASAISNIITTTCTVFTGEASSYLLSESLHVISLIQGCWTDSN